MENGSPDDVAKVQGMMPIVGKKRHVDPETGEQVEGSMSFSFSCFMASQFFRLGLDLC